MGSAAACCSAAATGGAASAAAVSVSPSISAVRWPVEPSVPFVPPCPGWVPWFCVSLDGFLESSCSLWPAGRAPATSIARSGESVNHSTAPSTRATTTAATIIVLRDMPNPPGAAPQGSRQQPNRNAGGSLGQCNRRPGFDPGAKMRSSSLGLATSAH